MSWIDRIAFWVFDKLYGPRFEAAAIKDLQEERAFLASEISMLRKRKKKFSHLLPALQHVTNELIRMEMVK